MEIVNIIFYLIVGYAAYVVLKIISGLVNSMCDNCGKPLTPIDRRVTICKDCVDKEGSCDTK